MAELGGSLARADPEPAVQDEPGAYPCAQSEHGKRAYAMPPARTGILQEPRRWRRCDEDRDSISALTGSTTLAMSSLR